MEERTKQLEETRDALVDAERLAALGRAGAALSHELRNSLNTLSVGMDALGASGDSAVPQQVRGEIGRLRSLADRLLDFARPRELRPTRLMSGELVSIRSSWSRTTRASTRSASRSSTRIPSSP